MLARFIFPRSQHTGLAASSLWMLFIVAAWNFGFLSAIVAQEVPQSPATRDEIEAEEAVAVEVQVEGNRIQQRQIRVIASFSRSIYGESEETAIAKLQSRLKSNLNLAQMNFELNPQEIKKLALAGRADINRQIEMIAAFDDRFCKDGMIAFEEIPKLQIELIKLQRELLVHDQFGPRTLYGKTLKKIVEQDPRRPKTVHTAAHNDRFQYVMLHIISEHVGSKTPLRSVQIKPVIVMLQRHLEDVMLQLSDDRGELVQILRKIPDTEFHKVLDPEQVRQLRLNLETI